ncbi:MAG TPA: O-antigen ligase family protein [Gemmatimonadaceae bacterium]
MSPEPRNPAEIPPFLAWLVGGVIVAMAAGTPLQMGLAGRTLTLGPSDLFVAALLLTLPLWFRRLPPLSLFTLTAMLFVVWVWVNSVFWSVDFRRSIMSAKGLLEGGIVFLAAWHVAAFGDRRGFPAAIRIFNTLLVVQIVWVLLKVLASGAAGYYGIKDGINVPLGGSNFIALFLEFGLFYELLSRRRFWLPFMALNGVGVVMTFSRGALLASAAMFLVTSIAVLGLRGQRRVAPIVLGSALAGLVALLTVPALQVFQLAFSLLGRTAGARADLWRAAWQAASWRPITGVGYGAYESVGTLRDVHSLPLALLAETGVVGLALFTVAMLAALFRVATVGVTDRDLSRRGESLGLAAGLAVVLVHSQIEPFFEGLALCWAGMVFAWIVGPWGPSAVVSAVPAAVRTEPAAQH